MKKWKNYLSFVVFSLLFSVFIPCFISENTSAISQTFTFYPGDVIPAANFGFDTSVFSSTSLYFSWSCERNANGDSSLYVRYDVGVGSSFVTYCTWVSSTIKLTSGIFILDYIPSSLGPYSTWTVPSSVDSFTFTLSDEPLGGGITPTGNIDITENGTFDVTQYAQATVNVPSSGGGDAPYTGILEGIKVSILTCGAIIVVLYFFYCFYRIIIRSTGGKQ